MIYFKMHADSKEDGMKCEHVIFTQACLQGTITSMRVLVPVRFGVGGRGVGGGGAVGGFENCVYLWKHPGYTPILYCIHHL